MATKSIQQVVLTNFKKHKHLALNIKGESFILRGKNEAGKSSILQAIDHMVRQADLPDEAITEGEDSGEIEVLLAANGDTYKVTRKMTAKKLGRYELKKDAGNGRFDTLLPAQERFQEIFGNVLDLSPLIDMDGAKQVALIQSIIGKDLGVKEIITEVQERTKKLREERLFTGRELRDYEAKMNVPEFRALVNFVDEEPVDLAEIAKDKVDVMQLSEEYRTISQKNDNIDAHANAILSSRNKMAFLSESDPIITKLDEVVSLLNGRRFGIGAIKDALDAAATTNDLVEARLDEARARNANIEKAKEYVMVKQAIKDKKEAYDNFTKEIRAELNRVSAALTRIGLEEVYPGLSLEYEMDEEGKVTKEGLFLRGLPFNRRQQSYGEMVKCLVIMSRAFNPDGFSYVKILDWNLLDDDNQAVILKVAEDNDIQLGIEKVDSSKELVLQLIEK